LNYLVMQLAYPDPKWTPAQIAAAKKEINNLAASLGPTGVTSANQAKAAASKNTLASLAGLNTFPVDPYDVNALAMDIPFDIVIKYQGGGRTITRMLEQCHLISNEQVNDQSGTPILDTYGFVARRLR